MTADPNTPATAGVPSAVETGAVDPGSAGSGAPGQTTADANAASLDRRAEDRRSGERRRVERALRQGAIALAVGIIALLVAVFATWQQVRHARELSDATSSRAALAEAYRRIDADLAALRSEAEVSAQALADVPTRLAAAETALEQVRARQAAPERSLARAETRYLVTLAQERLRLERDYPFAIALYQRALDRLDAAGDPALARVRAVIAQELATLKAVPRLDASQAGQRLAALESRARTLPVRGGIPSRYVPPRVQASEATGFARAWQLFTGAINDLISVRRVGRDTVEIVSLEEIGVRRHHLEMQLFAARLAAGRGDGDGYRAALVVARSWLDEFFDRNDSAVGAFAAELDELAKAPVAPLPPDLAGSRRLLDAQG